MTNAHVVAGVDDPEVEIDGTTEPADVVYYNPDLDIAVLSLDTGNLDGLPLRHPAEEKDGVAILGYPQDGPYDVQVGRIRSEQRLRSPDIYGEGTVIREVFSIRGLVRPGNSGGPIVDSDGDVVGVVFAASVTDDETGYALTADQVSESAATGATAPTSVDRRLRGLSAQPSLAARGDLPCPARSPSREPYLLDLLHADEGQEAGDEEVEAEDAEEGPVQGEAVAVPVDEVGDRHRQHDDREQDEEAGRAKRARPMPPALTLTFSSDFASWISLETRVEMSRLASWTRRPMVGSSSARGQGWLLAMRVTLQNPSRRCSSSCW